MSMKTMTASAASKEFGLYIDTVQHEPVVITKQNRPVGLFQKWGFCPSRVREKIG
ncbi:MAG: PHD/YefM family antitoxin component YafN of YafNO toxin-antitoxin module [Yoonia sp.]|jgi:PHD/YefM family antitoxin component YafN of YafNO toxin-antitoxin module